MGSGLYVMVELRSCSNISKRPFSIRGDTSTLYKIEQHLIIIIYHYIVMMYNDIVMTSDDVI